MRWRVIGRIVMVVLAVVLALLALQSTHKVSVTELHWGFRALAYGLLCLAAVVGCRYFED